MRRLKEVKIVKMRLMMLKELRQGVRLAII